MNRRPTLQPSWTSTWARLGAVGLALCLLLGSAVLPPSRPVQAEAILGTAVPVGSDPTTVVANPVTNRIYVANSGSNSVTVIDGATNARIDPPIAVGANPFALAVNPTTNRVYVANFADGTVTVIDASDNTILGNPIALGAGTNPVGVAVNTANNRVYVANQGTDTVSVIDGASGGNGGAGAVIGSPIPLGAGTDPADIAVNTSTFRVYTANPGTGTVTAIDGASGANGGAGAVVGTPIVVGSSPVGVAVNRITNRVYVANNASGTVTAIDGASGANGGAGGVIGTPIAVQGGANGLTGVAVNAVTNRVYVGNLAADDVVAIDGDGAGNGGAGTVLSTVALGAGADPTGLAVNPTTGFVYVANAGADTVSAIGTPFLREAVVGSPIPVGNGPIGMAVNPTTNRVYVANSTGNSVTVINGLTNAVVGTPIAVGTSPNRVAVNPVTNRVYVTNVTSSSVTVIDGGAAGNGGAGAVVGSPIAVGAGPLGVAVNPATNRVYVANQGPDTLTVIDGASAGNGGAGAAVGSPIPLGGGANPFDVAVNPVTNRVYVTNSGPNTVSVIDGASGGNGGAGAVVGSPIPVGTFPGGLAVNPTTNRVYVGSTSGDFVVVINGASTANDGAGDAMNLIRLGAGAIVAAVAVNPATNRVYVANVGPDNVMAIDGASDTILGLPISVGLNPAGAAVNPATGRVYVANAAANTVSVIAPSFGISPIAAPPGGSIQVTWASLFGTSPNDRIGLFAPGAANGSPVVQRFTNGTQTAGGAGLTQGTVNLPVPAGQAPGAYEVRLISGHSGQVLGSLAYRVVAPPTAVDDSYSVSNGSVLSVAAQNGVLANDSSGDLPAALQVAQLGTGPRGGTLNLQANGAFTYTPRADFAGTDTFTYRMAFPALGPGVGSAPATVTIAVNPVACGPRPSVTVQTAVSGGALQATVTANDVNGPSQNRLQQLQFGTFQNAQVTLNGQPVTDGQVVPLPANTTTQTIVVRRAAPGQATTVPVTVVDVCGTWPTFVGGGTSAGF